MSLLTSIQRRLQGCNRSQTLQFVWSTLKCASRTIDDLIRHITMDSDVSQVERLITDLNNSLTGLKSLQQTYTDDRALQCSLGTLHDEIKCDVDRFRLTIQSCPSIPRLLP